MDQDFKTEALERAIGWLASETNDNSAEEAQEELQALLAAAQVVAADSCLAKLKPGEPFFVLRAQDKLTPKTIQYWADAVSDAYAADTFTMTRKLDPDKGREKILLAGRRKYEVIRWQDEHGVKVPD